MRIWKRFIKLNILVLILSCVTIRIMAEGFSIIPTIDNASYQLTISLVDFPNNSSENSFLFDSAFHGAKAYPSLLSGYLSGDGYPFNKEGISMSTLFSDAIPVNHLFLDNSDNWWLFDSTQCFATLQGDRFILYHELGTTDKENMTTLDHGQFLPFNDLKPGVFSVHHANTYDALGFELPDDDLRKGEQLYLVQNPDHYFGLVLDAAFTFPAQNDSDEDLVASFTADDDLWVYIDGYLVLDLGGIHSAIHGSINFSTGAVTYRGADGKDCTTKLYKILNNRYKEQYPDARERDVQTFLDGIFTENSHWQRVFKDNTIHTIKLIYLERGAGASNLSIRFNLPILLKQQEGQ